MSDGIWDKLGFYLFGAIIGDTVGVGFEWVLKGRPSRKATIEAQGADGKRVLNKQEHDEKHSGNAPR